MSCIDCILHWLGGEGNALYPVLSRYCLSLCEPFDSVSRYLSVCLTLCLSVSPSVCYSVPCALASYKRYDNLIIFIHRRHGSNDKEDNKETLN